MTDRIICPTCEQDIHIVAGCTANYAYNNGDEPGTAVADTDCWDCAATPGYPHHTPPCTKASCRYCSDAAGELIQAFGCPHWQAQMDALEIGEP